MADFSVTEIKKASARKIELGNGVILPIDVGDFASALLDNLGNNVDRILGKGEGEISFADVKVVRSAMGQVLRPLLEAAGHDPKVVLAGLTIMVLFQLVKYVFTEFKEYDLKKKQLESSDSSESPQVSGSD